MRLIERTAPTARTAFRPALVLHRDAIAPEDAAGAPCGDAADDAGTADGAAVTACPARVVEALAVGARRVLLLMR